MAILLQGLDILSKLKQLFNIIRPRDIRFPTPQQLSQLMISPFRGMRPIKPHIFPGIGTEFIRSRSLSPSPAPSSPVSPSAATGNLPFFESLYNIHKT